MSERNELPPAAATPSTPAPVAPDAVGTHAPRTFTQEMASAAQSLPAPPSSPEDGARQRIAALEREARALGADPQAALLFHEIGLLWEDPLKNPRNAAVAFQNAFRAAPRFIANIQAARRLFADVGNWQMVSQLLDAELAANESPNARAALLFEKATVLEERLSREEEALKAYRLSLELKPQDVGLLVQLESVYAARGDWALVVEAQKQLADVVREDVLRAQYLTSAGQLLECRLNRPEDAAVCFRKAFTLNKKDPQLLAAAAQVAEREGKTDELLDVLAAEAEVLGAQAAPTYLRISKLYERSGRPEDALAALLAARRVTPTEPLVLSELARIHESQKRHEELADVLLSWVESVTDEGERVAINLRLAALYEESLKRDDEAIGRYRAILQNIPGHTAALAGLGKLYYRTQNWEGLVDVYDAEIAAAEDPRQQATRMYKAAEILEERLRREEDAIQRYNRCLQLQPGYLPAQKALTRLYERQGRFAELVAMHEQDLLQTSDREQMIATLNKIAAIYEDRLSDLDHAIDCMKRVLDLSPDHLPSLRHLARLYERAERWSDLIALQDAEAGLLADLKQVLSLHHRNAEILEEQLKDRSGAISAYERLLALSPSYLPALKSLGRLYAQEGRWEDLTRMYRAEAEISPTPTLAATLLFKIGELFEHRLRQPADAVAAYQEVLELVSTDYTALRALARLHRSEGAWEKLVEVLRAESASRTDPAERANALYQSAAIWEEQLQKVDTAVEGYQEVLRLTPGHSAALRALERIFTAQGNVKELIAVLDRQTQTGQTPAMRVSAYVRLAQLYLDRLDEPNRAAQCCEAALGIDPASLSALKLLERIRGSDRTRRADARARLAERLPESRLRTALKLSAVQDREAPGSEPLVEQLKTAFLENPADARVGFALERALRRAGDASGLCALYEQRLEAVTDPHERLELTLRVAEVCETKLLELPKALYHYNQALTLQPGFLPALQGARRVYLRVGDLAAARAAYEAEGLAARDPKSSIDAYVAAGRLAANELGDPEGAIAHFRRALGRDPREPNASAGLEDILAARGGTRDLASLQERRAEAKLAQKDHPAAAAEFFQAARTYLEKANDRPGAMAAVERALSAQPTHPGALELKGKLALEAHQYADAAAAYSLRVQQGGDAAALSRMHLTLGSLYQDHLSDASRAAAHLQTALASSDGRSTEALERLASIHTVSRNWTGASDCLKRLLELETEPKARARHQLALARICDEGFGDAAQASELYRAALSADPSSVECVDRLVALYERTGNLPELARLLEQQAKQTADRDRGVAIRLRVAELYARPLDEPQTAIALYREILELSPTQAVARAALAELYAREGNTVPQAVEEHRTLLLKDPARLDSLHALFRLWQTQKQTDRAFCAAGVLHFLRAETEAEAGFYAEHRTKIPAEKQAVLLEAERDLLLHPAARNNPLVDVLRAIGDQLHRLYPPALESLGVDKRADRLKADNPVAKALRSVAQLWGVVDFDVYQTKRGLMFLETTDPLSICVGQDVVRKFNVREQKFLMGRVVMGLFNKAAVLSKLSTGQTMELFGNAVRAVLPDYGALGKRNDELTKQIRKACSRKALKTLEGPAQRLVGAQPPDVHGTLEALSWSGDRAGLLLCGDVASGLSMLLRDDPNFSGVKLESSDPVLSALPSRLDLQEGMAFVLSDDFFRLRQRLGLALT